MATLDIEGAYWGEPQVTGERRSNWSAWVQNYAISTAQMWIEKGANRDEALRGAAAIIADFSCIDDEPWMPLGPALMERMSAVMSSSDEPLTGDARRQYILGLRTAETASESEQTAALAYQLGIARSQAEGMVRKIERAEKKASAGRTALYRHRDSSGVLLYVGIAHNPDARSEQHAAKSKWYRFVADTEVEWFATREEAAVAERIAIEDERPVFNDTHNRINRTAAIDYLLAALEKAGAA